MSVSILKQSRASKHRTETNPKSIFASDINRDGIIDIMTSNQAANIVSP